MPPSTRLSGAWNRDTGDSTSNLEQILENFEIFKRKHITQNRDIIKTNALAQLRIRELEHRVQALEADLADRGVELTRLQATLNRADHATQVLRRAWQGMELGFLAMARCDEPAEYEALLDVQRPGSIAARTPDDLSLPPHLLRSNRVSIDASLLPAGVVRSVSRPPASEMMGLDEREEQDDHCEPLPHLDTYAGAASSDTKHRWWVAGSDDPPVLDAGAGFGMDEPSSVRESCPKVIVDGRDTPGSDALSDSDNDGAHHALTAGVTRRRRSSKTFTSASKARSKSTTASASRATAVESEREPRVGAISLRRRNVELPEPVRLDAEGAPSPLASPSLDFDVGAGFLERARAGGAVTSARGGGSQWSEEAGTSAIRHPPSTEKTMEHAESLGATAPAAGAPSSGVERNAARLRHAASIDSLSSYVGDTEIEVSDDDEDHEEGATMRNARADAEAAAVAGPDVTRDDDRTLKLNLAPEEAGQAGVSRSPASASEVPQLHATTPERPQSRTQGGRKRKTASSPESSNLRATSATSDIEGTVAEDESAQGRGRRSGRVRKSINYALPKLNTKMRRPDPTDLVPATSTNRTSYASATSSESDASRTTANRRHGIGSSGNLSDIRKLHETGAEEGSGDASLSACSPRAVPAPLRQGGARQESPVRKDTPVLPQHEWSDAGAQAAAASRDASDADDAEEGDEEFADSDTSYDGEERTTRATETGATVDDAEAPRENSNGAAGKAGQHTDGSSSSLTASRPEVETGRIRSLTEPGTQTSQPHAKGPVGAATPRGSKLTLAAIGLGDGMLSPIAHAAPLSTSKTPSSATQVGKRRSVSASSVGSGNAAHSVKALSMAQNRARTVSADSATPRASSGSSDARSMTGAAATAAAKRGSAGSSTPSRPHTFSGATSRPFAAAAAAAAAATASTSTSGASSARSNTWGASSAAEGHKQRISLHAALTSPHHPETRGEQRAAGATNGSATATVLTPYAGPAANRATASKPTERGDSEAKESAAADPEPWSVPPGSHPVRGGGGGGGVKRSATNGTVAASMKSKASSSSAAPSTTASTTAGAGSGAASRGVKTTGAKAAAVATSAGTPLPPSSATSSSSSSSSLSKRGATDALGQLR